MKQFGGCLTDEPAPVRVLLAYIYVTGGSHERGGLKSDQMFPRFLRTYKQFPPQYPHDSVVVCNGGMPSADIVKGFQELPARVHSRPSNHGWDIGAYIDIARVSQADAILCCGESIYFHRAGWLKRLMQAWAKYGPGFYGVFSSHLVRAHLNTNAFLCARELLAHYPYLVSTRQQRYDFEHGPNALWRQASKANWPVFLVTWDGEYEFPNFRAAQNIMWRGTQENCLMWCTHSDAYFRASARTKSEWAANADRPAV